MISKYDNFEYEGACKSFHKHIIKGLSQPYTRELEIIKKYLLNNKNNNDTYIDIGGHIGTTSLPYSRLFKNIIVYETNYENYNHLINNIKRNNINNIIAKNKGVYNKNMKATIVKHGNNSGCYYIKESNDENGINVIRLDDEDIKGKIDFIKIDTEGSELFVLESAIELIKRDKPLIQVETNNCSNKFFGYNKDKIYTFMEKMNYKILDDNGNDPIFYSNHI
jgi:FkbM family methyltransferase